MSDEEFASFEDPIWDEMFRECAAEKLRELDDELLQRRAEFLEAQRKDGDDFRKQLREQVQRIFEDNIARERLKWSPFKLVKRSGKDADLIELKKFPIVNLFAFEKIRESGGRVTAICPFHEEGTPSFVIFPENNFYCFGCNEHGDNISFLMKLHEIKFKEAVASLKELSTAHA